MEKIDPDVIDDVTEIFHESQWKDFSRKKLRLEDEKIEELETKHKGEIKELKYQTVKHWKSTTGKNLDKLTTLKQEYFCSKSETIASKTVEAQQDLDGGKRRDEFSYPLKNGKGIALIISNSFADTEGHSSRNPGCEKDWKYMKNLWSKTLGCELVNGDVHCDKTADEMRDLLDKVGNTKDIDYAVVVISTHGGFEEVIENQETGLKKYEEFLYGNDGSKLQVSEFQEILSNKEAQPLRDIPKLLILQYCRGRIIDDGVTTDAVVFIGGLLEHQKTEKGYPVDALLPKKSDIITVYATHQDFVALRSDKGSWMIEYIYEVFEKYYKTKHVTDMLTIVNDRMKNSRGNIQGKDRKAMSIYESSLTKDFYLV
uniref:caspase-2-like n=1 Tax=Styela clava TaxID=7725 RepID=UPI00193AA6C0|nr:caspase-2-like [Styela clava]